MTEVISTGYRPHAFQAEIHRSLKRFSVVVAHRRFGKTVAAVNTLIDAAVRDPRGDGRYAYVAPYRTQAKRIAWDYLKQFTYPIPGCEPNESELFVRLPNGARIQLYGGDNADGMRGIYLDGVVMDEVADMRPDVWPLIVRPTLSDRRGWALFIGTPRGMNVFYDLYRQALADPTWWARMYRVDETDLIPQSEIDGLKRSMSDDQFRQEFMCDFSASAFNAFLSLDAVTDACRRTPGYIASDPMILGVDVARFGDDKTVICPRRGRDARTAPWIIMRGADTMAVAAKVIEQAELLRADAVFIDETGVGAGVVDRVRQIGVRPGVMLVGINFGGKGGEVVLESGDVIRASNMGAAMWAKLRDHLNTVSLPNDEELMAELTARQYSYTADNAVQLERKEELKKRGMPSPDKADALALTYAYPVRPRPVMGQIMPPVSTGVPQRVLADYDLHADLRG